MFRVGRLRNADEPWKIKAIKDPKKLEAYKAAGLPPIGRSIDYAPGGGPITINDVFGFFQSSSLKALEGLKITLSHEEKSLLEGGKANRRRMAELPLEEVKKYHAVELFALCRVMDKLRTGLKELGLNLLRWQGAGAIAEAMLKKERATHYFPLVHKTDPRPEQEWAHQAFFGGRIELCQQGRYAGQLHAYDITSAHPSVMAALPAMVIPQYAGDDVDRKKPIRRRRGKWIWRHGLELDIERIARMSPLSIIELKFDLLKYVLDNEGETCEPPFYPLPYRRDDGAILFPAKWWGRYYRDEVLAAFEWLDVMCAELPLASRRASITIVGAYEFIPPQKAAGEGPHYPFTFLRDLFEERRRIADAASVSNSYDVREKVIKLGINSVYGKTAQQLGGKRSRAPATANPWIAGAITAGTRAQLLKAALKDPWAIIFFATDGVQAARPLGVESETKTLGGWERDNLTAGVWIKPGVYAFSRDDKGKTNYTGKSRGMSVSSVLGDVEPENRDEAWFRYLDDVAHDFWTRGERSLSSPHERFVTFGFAVSTEDNWRLAGSWLETDRELDLNDPGIKRNNCSNPKRARGLVPLAIAENETPDELSRKHVPQWLDDEKRIAGEWMQDNQEIALARFEEEVWEVGD